MIFRIMSVFLFLLFTNKTYSNDLYLRDLTDVIKQEESASNFVYVFDRCAGLFAAVGNRFIASGRADSKSLGDKMMRIGTEFNIASVNIAKAANLNHTIKNSMSEAVAIGKIYSSIMNNNHRRTGNALVGQVASDQKICISIYKELKRK